MIADQSKTNRALDLVLGIVFLLLFIIPVIISAFLIKLNEPSEDITFSQKRVGKHGEEIKILKLRTMYTESERPKSGMGETRTTIVGKYLRMTAIDEVPQLWNVYKGEMSVVGPRPITLAEHNELIEKYNNWECRTATKPGITGLAQIQLLDTNFPNQMLRCDLKYIKSTSIQLDIQIFITTVLMVYSWILEAMYTLVRNILFSYDRKPKRTD